MSDVERKEGQRNSCTCEEAECERCCVSCGIFVGLDHPSVKMDEEESPVFSVKLSIRMCDHLVFGFQLPKVSSLEIMFHIYHINDASFTVSWRLMSPYRHAYNEKFK